MGEEILLTLAGPAVLSARVLLALIAAPLLYRELGDKGEGWGGGTAAVVRRAVFASLGAASLFLLTASWVPEDRDPNVGRGFEAYVQGVLNHRLSHSLLS